MGEIIDLTFGEMSIALHIAGLRRASNCLKKRPATNGQPVGHGIGRWEPDFMACMSEVAVAKYTNLFWSGTLGDMKARDVGGIVEVRHIETRDRRLIVHKSCADDAPFVLVWPDPPRFHLLGWLFGHECKDDKYWNDPAGGRPAYFVPQSDLRPMQELISWLREIAQPDRQAQRAMIA